MSLEFKNKLKSLHPLVDFIHPGKFQGGFYSIEHRDTNTVVSFTLDPGAIMRCKPGTLIAAPRSVQVKGDFQFSFKKMFTGDQMSYLDLTGPGQAIVGPHALGDIIPIFLDGRCSWYAPRDAFLAHTPGLNRVSRSQSFGKTLFSGAGLFIHEYSGVGILWLETFGAIMRKDLQPGEEYIVHTNNCTAWNCRYEIESLRAGGIVSTLAAGEGLFVCKFTGPGTIFFQTRSAESFGRWVAKYVPQQTNSN